MDHERWELMEEALGGILARIGTRSIMLTKSELDEAGRRGLSIVRDELGDVWIHVDSSGE